MNSVSSVHPQDHSSSSRHSRLPPDVDIKQIVAAAYSALEQPAPPTLREILGAYRQKGDGDRDMLLAMLNAKAAEDQRLASLAALHRTVLDVYQVSASSPPTADVPPRVNGSHHYPTPSFTHSPTMSEHQSSSRHIHPRGESTSRSPRRHHSQLPSMRDTPMYRSELPRKRHRSSLSPPSTHLAAYDPHSGSQHEQLPPSPYSSSGRSDSAENSPRSRTSMAIGSLLSSGPNKELMNGDES